MTCGLLKSNWLTFNPGCIAQTPLPVHLYPGRITGYMSHKEEMTKQRMRNNIPMEGVTETKFGAETEGMAIQRL
ncbi:mCG141100 [Mus musculus]|nr:mCG141100 [Mus musculus]